jgi:hypothetical protein
VPQDGKGSLTLEAALLSKMEKDFLLGDFRVDPAKLDIAEWVELLMIAGRMTSGQLDPEDFDFLEYTPDEIKGNLPLEARHWAHVWPIDRDQEGWEHTLCLTPEGEWMMVEPALAYKLSQAGLAEFLTEHPKVWEQAMYGLSSTLQRKIETSAKPSVLRPALPNSG